MVNFILKKWFKFTNKEIKQIKKSFYETIQKANFRDGQKRNYYTDN